MPGRLGDGVTGLVAGRTVPRGSCGRAMVRRAIVRWPHDDIATVGPVTIVVIVVVPVGDARDGDSGVTEGNGVGGVSFRIFLSVVCA